jgi:hypothetical protein
LNKNNCPDVLTEAIDKSGGVCKVVRVWGIGRKLFDQVHKAVDIVLDCGRLFDVEELANEELVLIAAKTLADHTAERGPVDAGELALDGLEPAAGCASELHSGALNQH